jgi:hypothetical protein
MKQCTKSFFLSAACLLALSAARSQAPPGPITPPPSAAGTVSAAPAPPKKPEVAARKTILGAWRFNKDESDDPRSKITTKDAGGSSGGGGGGYGGPRIGFPGGGPMGGGPGLGSGRQTTSPQDDAAARMGNLINPPRELQMLRRNEDDPEVEVYDDRDRRQIFYTDGRQIQKQKDPSLEEISAKWDGNRLVTDEKGPHNGKITRTFELSPDGMQLRETAHITDSKGNHPITVNYTYDAVNPQDLSFPAH